MKKHIMELSYKDLHAIKHALEVRLEEHNDKLSVRKYKLNRDRECLITEAIIDYTLEIEQLKQDIEHETKLLERITEKINYLKDKYKI